MKGPKTKPKCEPKRPKERSRNHQNDSQNPSEINETSRLLRRWVFKTFWGAPRCEKSSARCEIGWPFGNHFRLKIEKLVSTDPKLSQKSENLPFGIYVKLDAEKGRKSMPEGSQNYVKMYAEIIDLSCFYEKCENVPNYLFYNRTWYLKMGENP